jgi:FtsH-binding integral membrane protein
VAKGLTDLQAAEPIIDPQTGRASPYFLRYLFDRGGFLTSEEAAIAAILLRRVIAGAGLAGGGPLSADVTLKLERYQFGFFAVSAPTASETLCLHVAPVAFTIPANFVNSRGAAGTAPTATYTITVSRQVNSAGAFTTIGTISISTGSVVTFATSGGVDITIAAGDVLKFTGQVALDATLANAVITIVGLR